jgi:hypothetical protein
MRHRLVLGSAVGVFLGCAALSTLTLAQEPQRQGGPGRGVQVGVPEGRQGGPGPGRQGGPGRQSGPPPGPAPRSADGRVLLGSASPTQKGVWLPGNGGFTTATQNAAPPFQPWAAAVYANRGRNQLEPHTRCKPSGAARQFLTPYGVEFVELSELQRIYIFDIGGPHTFRTIYMDGRTHPANLAPSYYGHSTGWWDGDTLVVDTMGYNEGFWIDRRGLPTTEKLRTLERFTRLDSATIKYELTVDDPGAYTATWSTGFNLRWEEGTELFEYVCQQANYAPELMVGAEKSIDRTSTIVP